jgi:hypothetical protein
MNFVETKVGKLQALNDSSGYKNPTKILNVMARPLLIHHTIYSSDQCDDQQRYLAPIVDVERYAFLGKIKGRNSTSYKPFAGGN